MRSYNVIAGVSIGFALLLGFGVGLSVGLDRPGAAPVASPAGLSAASRFQVLAGEAVGDTVIGRARRYGQLETYYAICEDDLSAVDREEIVSRMLDLSESLVQEFQRNQ